MYLYIRVCIFIFIFVYIYTYVIYVDIYLYVHTHRYIYIYTYIYVHLFLCVDRHIEKHTHFHIVYFSTQVCAYRATIGAAEPSSCPRASATNLPTPHQYPHPHPHPHNHTNTPTQNHGPHIQHIHHCRWSDIFEREGERERAVPSQSHKK